jgi:beta-glucosidase
VDAVHGHSNRPGATIFPHSVGLEAARDPELIRRIAEATAAEVAASGIEWTFAPTLAVPQDLRWGRTYEGYSSDPSIMASYARAMTVGFQGELVAGADGRPARDFVGRLPFPWPADARFPWRNRCSRWVMG